MTLADAPSTVCNQTDCPIATEGRCLEGFPSGEGCPHLGVEESQTEDVDADDLAHVAAAAPEQRWVLLGGNSALSTDEANEAAAEHGALVVLVAGEFEAGKTTLLVELYGQFLRGPFNGWKFAGSRCLMALDRRHFPTRYASGNHEETTDRTEPDQEGLIHLRLWNGDRNLALFFTDYRGERFEHVTNGVPAEEEIPDVHRADKCLLLVDGARIADLAQRQGVVHRAKQLIGGLTDSGGVRSGAPFAVVLTKADLLSDGDMAWFEDRAAELTSFAKKRGVEPLFLTIAARPQGAPDTPEGLGEVLNWLAESRTEDVIPTATRETGDRQFWSLGCHE